MSRRVVLAAFTLVLAACGGGGGGGSTSGYTPPTNKPTPTPTPAATPGAYATLAPASSRAGDVKTLATGSGAQAIAYWPDYNIVAVGVSSVVVNAADGKVLGSAPDSNNVMAVAYNPSTHGIVFATPVDVYAVTAGGPVTTLAMNLGRIQSLAVGADGSTYAVDTDHIVKIAGGVSTNVTAPGTIGANNAYARASVAVASDGSLIVSDPTNDVIERVSTSGSITPLAGSCKPGAGNSGSAGNCWHVGISGTGSSANFASPGAIAYDAATGTVYVADTQNNQVWSVTSSGVATPVAGYGAMANADGNGLAAFLNAPSALTFQPNSASLDILENGPNSQQEIAAFSTTGTAAPSHTPPASAVLFPNGLETSNLGASPDGSAWAVDANQKSIDLVSSSGSVTKFATPSGIAPTWHVAVDANGNAWFLASHMASYGIILDQGVLEVTPSGAETYVAATLQHSGSTGFVQMEQITIGPDGNPWFTGDESMNGGSFGFVNASTHAMTQYPTSVGPNGISQAPNGGIAFSTSTAIQFASTNGTLGSSYPVSINGADSLQYRASDGSLWFTDVIGTIASMSASGAEQNYTACGNCDPVNLTIAPDGSVWSDEGNWSGGIVRITPSGQVMQYLLPTSTGPTYGISARSDGKLWVYNNMGVLYLFDPAAYDAMNGPHPTQALQASARIGMPWRSI